MDVRGFGGVVEQMSHKGESGFFPERRELVFDIDMDDYSPVAVSGLLFRRFAIAARERISAQNAGVL